jgi:hypothetical protein
MQTDVAQRVLALGQRAYQGAGNGCVASVVDVEPAVDPAHGLGRASQLGLVVVEPVHDRFP